MRTFFIRMILTLFVLGSALPVAAAPAKGGAMSHMKKAKTVKTVKKSKAPVTKKAAPKPKAKPKQAATMKQAGPKTVHVPIKNFAFTVPSVTVKKGDIVHFMNEDSAPHTVTAVDELFKGSDTLNNGGIFGLDTSTLAPGTYEYFCNFHPSMKGTIVVQ